MATPSLESLVPLHRLSIADFQRMGELGMFDENRRVELVEGVLVDMMMIRVDHARATMWISRWLARTLPEHLAPWSQTDVVLPDLICQLQPDAAIVRFDDLVERLPEAPLLVIEVSDSSLRYDRIAKARLYARHGVPEYWIVNLVDGCVEVHRDPADDAYGSREIVQEPSVLEVPGLTLDVPALLAFAYRGER